MSEIVNLRQARKRAARAAREAQAAENRARHGAGKAEYRLADAERSALRRTLDGAKRATEDDAQS